MSHYKSDEPFGLLPKKTAMALDSVGGLFSMPLRRAGDPISHSDPRLDVPSAQPAKRSADMASEVPDDTQRKPA